MASTNPTSFAPQGLPVALAARLRVDTSGCWIWTGYRRPDGYGIFSVDNKPRMAHRLVYEALCGPITKETLDHLCRVRACCNPEHLEPASRRVNTLRSDNAAMLNARKPCCPKCGGEFEQRTDSNRRICKPCFQAYARDYQSAARMERAAADGRTIAPPAAERTHCPHGHPYSGDNLIETKRGRACRECGRARSLAAYHRRKAAA